MKKSIIERIVARNDKGIKGKAEEFIKEQIAILEDRIFVARHKIEGVEVAFKVNSGTGERALIKCEKDVEKAYIDYTTTTTAEEYWESIAQAQANLAAAKKHLEELQKTKDKTIEELQKAIDADLAHLAVLK